MPAIERFPIESVLTAALRRTVLPHEVSLLSTSAITVPLLCRVRVQPMLACFVRGVSGDFSEDLQLSLGVLRAFLYYSPFLLPPPPSAADVLAELSEATLFEWLSAPLERLGNPQILPDTVQEAVAHTNACDQLSRHLQERTHDTSCPRCHGTNSFVFQLRRRFYRHFDFSVQEGFRAFDVDPRSFAGELVGAAVLSISPAELLRAPTLQLEAPGVVKDYNGASALLLAHTSLCLYGTPLLRHPVIRIAHHVTLRRSRWLRSITCFDERPLLLQDLVNHGQATSPELVTAYADFAAEPLTGLILRAPIGLVEVVNANSDDRISYEHLTLLRWWPEGPRLADLFVRRRWHCPVLWRDARVPGYIATAYGGLCSFRDVQQYLSAAATAMEGIVQTKDSLLQSCIVSAFAVAGIGLFAALMYLAVDLDASSAVVVGSITQVFLGKYITGLFMPEPGTDIFLELKQRNLVPMLSHVLHVYNKRLMLVAICATVLGFALMCMVSYAVWKVRH